MDEARRFLRYFTPGVLFVSATMALSLVLSPSLIDHLIGLFKRDYSDKGVALALAGVAGSGVIGFVLSNIHHAIYWASTRWGMDHRDFVADLQRDFGDHPLFGWQQWKRHQSNPIEDALITVGLFWFQERARLEGFEEAVRRLNSFGDMLHGLGTASIAAFASLPSASLVTWFFRQRWGYTETTLNPFLMTMSWIVLAGVFCFSYYRVRRLMKDYYQSTVWAAVVLTRQGGTNPADPSPLSPLECD